jgi:hypothetical protein
MRIFAVIFYYTMLLRGRETGGAQRFMLDRRGPLVILRMQLGAGSARQDKYVPHLRSG